MDRFIGVTLVSLRLAALMPPEYTGLVAIATHLIDHLVYEDYMLPDGLLEVLTLDTAPGALGIALCADYRGTRRIGVRKAATMLLSLPAEGLCALATGADDVIKAAQLAAGRSC